jgi:hypothetical protein
MTVGAGSREDGHAAQGEGKTENTYGMYHSLSSCAFGQIQTRERGRGLNGIVCMPVHPPRCKWILVASLPSMQAFMGSNRSGQPPCRVTADGSACLTSTWELTAAAPLPFRCHLSDAYIGSIVIAGDADEAEYTTADFIVDESGG